MKLTELLLEAASKKPFSELDALFPAIAEKLAAIMTANPKKPNLALPRLLDIGPYRFKLNHGDTEPKKNKATAFYYPTDKSSKQMERDHDGYTVDDCDFIFRLVDDKIVPLHVKLNYYNYDADDPDLDDDGERIIDLHPAAKKARMGLKLTNDDFTGSTTITDGEVIDQLKLLLRSEKNSGDHLPKVADTLQLLSDTRPKELKEPIMASALIALKRILKRHADGEEYKPNTGAELMRWINTLRQLGYDYPEFDTIKKKLAALATHHLDHDETHL